jgi:CspA family cold shock protein
MPNRVTLDPAEDEIRFCERCGISFVWTIEEQKQPAADQETVQGTAPAAPVHCTGCRRLLPAPGRERGQVKWYNARKRYGFIVRNGQPDIFVSAAAIRGRRMLHSGDLVEFGIGENSSGPVAEAVTVLAPATQLNQTTSPQAGGAPAANSSTKSS